MCRAGSVSSLRQQAGRAGRGGTDSLAIMVLFQVFIFIFNHSFCACDAACLVLIRVRLTFHACYHTAAASTRRIFHSCYIYLPFCVVLDRNRLRTETI